MAEAGEQQQITLDANVLHGANAEEGLRITYQTEDGETLTTITSGSEGADIVSKAFTTVADGTEGNVEYITMTPEEAAAAGVVAAPEEEEQVVTTSLQFDPANPSVLYTADGTPINQADLTPEEQALVQAALQQHLADQEAERQLALMQEDGTVAPTQGAEASQVQAQPTVTQAVDGAAVTSTSLQEQQPELAVPQLQKAEPQVSATVSQPIMVSSGLERPVPDTTVTSTGEPVVFRSISDAFDLASPATSASQIVQTLANNVRKRQLEEKLKLGLPRTVQNENDTKYSEKIVIKEGQPQVVKVPIKKQPDIPAALASLMPKVEIGKDGSQVIRIHQSQITQNQLKALQENPNVRLVFRPASSKTKTASTPVMTPPVAKKRGRPRKNPDDPTVKIVPDKVDLEPEIEDPPAKTRCGRVSKRPVYTKDYLTPKISKDMDDDTIDDLGEDDFAPKSDTPLAFGEKRPRGRPPNPNKNVKRTSYASKIEALQGRDGDERDYLTLPPKPALTPIEQALSTRRKNRLREMLSACSEDEIMEVAMPHIARVFSLWEFLVTKVEKNKMSRVFFADIYKEYECLHKYIAKLAEKYKQAIEEKPEEKTDAPETTEPQEASEAKENEEQPSKDESNEANGSIEHDKKPSNEVQVTYAKLAESLGLKCATLKEAEISLLDPEEAIGPRIMGMIHSSARRGQGQKHEEKTARKYSYGMYTSIEAKKDVQPKSNAIETAKPVQTEATSTISSTAAPTQNANIPPLKPMAQTDFAVATTSTASQPIVSEPTPMETDAIAQTVAETTAVNTVTTEAEAATVTGGTQLIQIGQGEDQQFIEVPEGYNLIQTPEGLVMSQPGTTISQGEDGTIYITHADGTTTPLNAATQQAVQMETVESLLSLEGQQPQT